MTKLIIENRTNLHFTKYIGYVSQVMCDKEICPCSVWVDENICISAFKNKKSIRLVIYNLKQ